AARIFGASQRDTNCDCNRSNEPNLLQSIYLQNDQEMLAAIERKGSWVAESDRSRPADAIEEAYLRTLNRLPDAREAAVAARYLADAGEPAKGIRDLLWALLNTKEFITNH